MINNLCLFLFFNPIKPKIFRRLLQSLILPPKLGFRVERIAMVINMFRSSRESETEKILCKLFDNSFPSLDGRGLRGG